MKETEVNRLIRTEVDKIDDPNKKQLIKEVLKFERMHMDLEQPHYKDDFKELIETYGPEEGTETDGGFNLK